MEKAQLDHALKTAKPMMIPTPQPDEPSVQELAENMSDKEFRSLVIMTFRYVRDIHEFCQDLKEALAGMGENGGMMGKMIAGMMPPMPPGLIPPPPPKFQQQHPHTNGGRRR